MRLTRRFIVKSLDGISLSQPLRYERYYINDRLRVQKKENYYEKEILNEDNIVVDKCAITEKEFNKLKRESYSKIVRDSYLYLKDDRVSIKQYYEDYEGFNRAEVQFSSKEEMANYQKEEWMDSEITESPLAFDKFLSKLKKDEFLLEIKRFIK